MRKITLHREKEQGQAILLIAVLMLALIAMLGLAIDGGGIFLLYRDVQNATDSAGLAAAYDLCSGGNPIDSAESSAKLNGFDPDENPDITVDIEHPVYTRTDLIGEPEEYVLVTISADKPSYFIQVVYNGPLRVSATTLVRCRPGLEFPFPSNSAVVALSDQCSGTNPAINLNNPATFQIADGSMFVNCDDANSVRLAATAYIDGTVCTLGDITYMPGTTFNQPGVDTEVLTGTDCPFDQLAGDQRDDPLGLSHLSSTDICGPIGLDIHGNPAVYPLNSGFTSPPAVIDDTYTVADETDPSTWQPWEPGNYTNINIPAGEYAFLQPGHYCVQGNINIEGGLYGDGVFIYQSCSSCTYQVEGSAWVHLTPPGSGDYEGLLTYSRSTNRNESRTDIQNQNNFDGDRRMDVYGTMYFPAATCNLSGTGNDYIYAQYICWEFNFNGNSETELRYDPAAAYRRPARFGIEE